MSTILILTVRKFGCIPVSSQLLGRKHTAATCRNFFGSTELEALFTVIEMTLTPSEL